MRLLLTGGGTAGHINPALAIAETVLEHDPSAVIEFVGIRTGKEADLIPREGYKLHFVRSMGIRRSLSPANIKAVWLALTSPYAKETQQILDDFRPDLVIGTGGYASWPIMRAAAKRGIPTAVHESNAIPGMTVKRLERHVDRIWLNFAQTAKQLKYQDKIVCTGNPLRRAFGVCDKDSAKRALGLSERDTLLLSFGGSLGAEAVNLAVLDVMERICTQNPNVICVHAAGKRDFGHIRAEFEGRGLNAYPNCRLVDYIYQMPLYMSAADCVIARAGAMTLSELATLKKAAILIPSPYVADNHQFKNAKALADREAALLVEEKTLADGALTVAAEQLLTDTAMRAKQEQNIAAFADSHANERIWEEIQMLTGKSNA